MGLLRHDDYLGGMGQGRGFLDQHGYSLLEMMVVLTLLGVMTLIATPSFNAVLYQNRLQAAASMMTSEIAFARSEAIRRGVNVVVCFSTNQTSCASRLVLTDKARGDKWKDYHLVFADLDGDTYYNNSDVLLRIGEKIRGTGGYDEFTNKSTCSYIGFYPTGENLDPCYVRFGYQATGGCSYSESSQWTIVINRAGRISSKKTEKLYE